MKSNTPKITPPKGLIRTRVNRVKKVQKVNNHGLEKKKKKKKKLAHPSFLATTDRHDQGTVEA
jgi:hypothetical protein